MNCQEVQLVASASRTGRVCTVAARTFLTDLLRQIPSESRGLLLVEDDVGAPIGVVDLAEVRRLAESPNACMWPNGPAGIVLIPPKSAIALRPTSDCGRCL